MKNLKKLLETLEEFGRNSKKFEDNLRKMKDEPNNEDALEYISSLLEYIPNLTGWISSYEKSVSEDIEKLNETLVETLSSVDKNTMSDILTLYNINGRAFLPSDISDEVVNKFNSFLTKFSKENENFDVFGKDYTGKETDDFINGIISTIGGSGLSLFESKDIEKVVTDGIESKDPSVISVDDSKIIGKMINSKLVESMGSRFDSKSIFNEVRNGKISAKKKILSLIKL